MDNQQVEKELETAKKNLVELKKSLALYASRVSVTQSNRDYDAYKVALAYKQIASAKVDAVSLEIELLEDLISHFGK